MKKFLVSFIFLLATALPSYANFQSFGISVQENGNAVGCSPNATPGLASFLVEGPEVTQIGFADARGYACILKGNTIYIYGQIAAGNPATWGILIYDYTTMQKISQIPIPNMALAASSNTMVQDVDGTLVLAGVSYSGGGAVVRVNPANGNITVSNRTEPILAVANSGSRLYALSPTKVEILNSNLSVASSITMPAGATSGALAVSYPMAVARLGINAWAIDLTTNQVVSPASTKYTNLLMVGDKVFGGINSSSGEVVQSTWPNINNVIVLNGPKPFTLVYAMGSVYGTDPFAGVRRVTKLTAVTPVATATASSTVPPANTPVPTSTIPPTPTAQQPTTPPTTKTPDTSACGFTVNWVTRTIGPVECFSF